MQFDVEFTCVTLLIFHLLAGVSFVDTVEDNFSICDVTVLKLGENIVLESKPEECVITGNAGESEEKGVLDSSNTASRLNFTRIFSAPLNKLLSLISESGPSSPR